MTETERRKARVERYKANKAKKRYYNHPDDKGAKLRNFEVDARFLATPHSEIGYSKGLGKVDHFVTDFTKSIRLRIEYKGGSGTVDYNLLDQLDVSLPPCEHINDLFQSVDVVVYAPEYENGDDVGEAGFVFTRQQFIDMLNGYKGMVKYNNKGGHRALNIQTFTGDKNHLRADYIMNACLDMVNYGEWLESIGHKLPERE